MAEQVRRDNVPRPADADEHSHGDLAAKINEARSRAEFSLRQDSLSVPKPSYHKHVDDGAELGEPEEFEGEEWREAAEHEPTSDATSSSKRTRRFRIRWWGIVLFIFLYAAFKLMRFDQ